MDSVLSRALAGAPHMHLQTQRTFHVEQEGKSAYFFPPPRATGAARESNFIQV